MIVKGAVRGMQVRSLHFYYGLHGIGRFESCQGLKNKLAPRMKVRNNGCRGEDMVSCDNCKAEFETHLHIEHMDQGVERAYMKCPECGQEYTSYYTNKYIRKKQAEVRKKWANFRSTKNLILKDKLQKEIDKLTKEIKEEMSNLKSLF